MINSNKKQILIFIAIILFMILIIAVYFFKVYNSNYESIDPENILENNIQNTLNNSTSSNIESDVDSDYIIVHITGAINNPGIVKLKTGSRIADAINNAGGFTTDADISSINLAYKLDDGQKIYVPYINENNNDISTEENTVSSDAGENIILEDNSYSSNNSKNIDLININSATQTELETIPGIGPSTALKIITYRIENGKFSSIEDIKNVSGIGDSKFENIKNYITIK